MSNFRIEIKVQTNLNNSSIESEGGIYQQENDPKKLRQVSAAIQHAIRRIPAISEGDRLQVHPQQPPLLAVSSNKTNRHIDPIHPIIHPDPQVQNPKLHLDNPSAVEISA